MRDISLKLKVQGFYQILFTYCSKLHKVIINLQKEKENNVCIHTSSGRV